MRKTLTLLSTLLFLNIFAEEDCGETPQSKRFVVRHLEGSGIGYDRGYTSVDLFLASTKVWDKSFVSFLDLRGHLFNNSKFASNLGFGGRYVGQSRIWGGNMYYDYRNSGRKHYNQIAGGLESLGRIWDFRLNGYYPIGSKHSSFFNKGFDRFEGNCAILSAQREFALKGFNAEVGAHVDHFKKTPLYFAGGTYYLKGEGKSSWGRELRVVLTLLDHIRLEGETSYDSLYKWTGRGQISAIIPFGKRAKVKKRDSCHRAMALGRRVFQRVDRHEIIPVDEVRKTNKAYDPKTCVPHNFIFVNNQCNSDGTAESPYPLLTTALANSSEGDIIYVFPGDGTPYSTSVVGGFQLLDHQRLLGSGISHPLTTQFGTIRIPSQSGTYPNVRNTAAGSTVINLANHNEVAGMHVVGSTILNGINAADSSAQVSGRIRENWVEVSNSGGNVNGIRVNYGNAAGQARYVIVRNLISNLVAASGSNSIGITASNSGASSSFNISRNRIANLVAANSINGISASNSGDQSSFNISHNRISNLTKAGTFGCNGISASNSGDQSSMSISHNRISNLSASSSRFGINASNSGDQSSFSISNNRISNITVLGGGVSPSFGIRATNSGDQSSFSISNNRISNLTSNEPISGIKVDNTGTGSSFGISNNRISNLTSVGLVGRSGIEVLNSGAGVSFAILRKNQISDLAWAGSINGILAQTTGGELCLVIIDNFAPQIIQLTNGGGVFNVDPSSQGNNPKPIATGNVIYNACAP